MAIISSVVRCLHRCLVHEVRDRIRFVLVNHEEARDELDELDELDRLFEVARSGWPWTDFSTWRARGRLGPTF